LSQHFFHFDIFCATFQCPMPYVVWHYIFKSTYLNLTKERTAFFITAQGCQMVSLRTKNPNLGKFWRALDWTMLIYFMVIWNILQTFGIFYDHLVHFVFIWYIFPVWVIFTKKNLATLEQRRLLGLCRSWILRARAVVGSC
jgi:hypothetical protein